MVDLRVAVPWAVVAALASCGGGGTKSFVSGDVVAEAGGDPGVADVAGRDPMGQDPAADEAAPDEAPPDYGPWKPDGPGEPGGGDQGGSDADGDAIGDAVEDAETPPATCGFNYDFPPFDGPPGGPAAIPAASGPRVPSRPGEIVHGEPDPPSLFPLRLDGKRGELVMPGYEDAMPLFGRAEEWEIGQTRCYETPIGAVELSEPAAWTLYREVAEKTVGVAVDTTIGHRTVVGIRGAYPGTFAWNGNGPNRFNDTIALLWRDEQGRPQVLEFAAHTDTGAYRHDGGMSSLWPNRHYRYRNGWHKTYNALRIDEIDYRVRDDNNSNGHWDSDRNAWLPPEGEPDFDREGSAHNIHYAQATPPLETAIVGQWSAGCQNIPGMKNWTQFITHAWVAEGEPADYFLVDARDIDPTVWGECVPDGSHACPFRIDALPFGADGDTAGWPIAQHDAYPTEACSTADESGPEVTYVLNLHEPGTLRAVVTDGDGVDIDVHLLMGDEPMACIARDDTDLAAWIPPGRYLIVADTYVKDGTALAGEYHLAVALEP